MTIYIDITQLEKQRVNTGIQRVVKEFLQRAITQDSPTTYKVLLFNTTLNKMQILSNKDVALFLKDIKKFQFNNRKTIEIERIKPNATTIFFDLDSGWNAPYKREKLYPILKENGFLIYNFIYDLIPVLLPQFVQSVTINNYKPFIQTVYAYSDMVISDSISTENDFLAYKTSLNYTRDIKTTVVGLGSDFLLLDTVVKDIKIQSLLEKKYILFVGTLEPRKNQEEVLNAFDIVSKKHTDLHLIFIGMKGWKNDKFIQRIQSHPLKDKRLYWLNNIDDDTLYHFYENAFLVTYLSKYEGFGLPIIESLQHGNITITSNNSSMPEVGLNFAEYIDDGNLNQLVDTISLYTEDTSLYNTRKKYIKDNFKPLSWDGFANLMFTILKEEPVKEKINKEKTMDQLKNKIKTIPIIGWFARWSNNILRLNNLKHKVYQQQKQLNKQKLQINTLQKQVKKLNESQDNKLDIQKLQSQVKQLSQSQEKKIASSVAKQISVQSDSFTQRLEQFIFDAKIDLKLSKDNNESD